MKFLLYENMEYDFLEIEVVHEASFNNVSFETKEDVVRMVYNPVEGQTLSLWWRDEL